MLLLAAAFVSAGFLEFPPGVEIGPLSAVAVDREDRIYVLHRGPLPLLAFDKHGKYLHGWGAGLFKVAHGLRIGPAGAVWTTDNGNHEVRGFTPAGKPLATLTARFKAPDDIVFARDGSMFVADTGNARILKLSSGGAVLSQWGRKGTAEGEFATAHGLAIDSRDRIYVADRGNNRVQVFDSNGNFLAAWTGFGNPFGLLIVGGELLVSDGDAHRITHLSLDDGRITAQWGDPQSLQLPHLMAVDSRGRLYIAEVNGKRVQIFERAPR